MTVAPRWSSGKASHLNHTTIWNTFQNHTILAHHLLLCLASLPAKQTSPCTASGGDWATYDSLDGAVSNGGRWVSVLAEGGAAAAGSRSVLVTPRAGVYVCWHLGHGGNAVLPVILVCCGAVECCVHVSVLCWLSLSCDVMNRNRRKKVKEFLSWRLFESELVKDISWPPPLPLWHATYTLEENEEWRNNTLTKSHCIKLPEPTQSSTVGHETRVYE